jgi:hypothetical protein
MDEKHGNVIDGTARSRQWRRSKPTDDTNGGPHSEAPKRIATSLLIPADMHDGVPMPALADPALPADGVSARAVGAEPTTTDDTPSVATHENLFLSAGAEVVITPSRRAGRIRVAAGR